MTLKDTKTEYRRSYNIGYHVIQLSMEVTSLKNMCSEELKPTSEKNFHSVRLIDGRTSVRVASRKKNKLSKIALAEKVKLKESP